MRTSNPRRDPLPKPVCPYGYTARQLNDLLGDARANEFWRWMRGQTLMLCEGWSYDHDRRENVPDACNGHPHGVIIYPWDFQRWVDWQQGGPTPLWD